MNAQPFKKANVMMIDLKSSVYVTGAAALLSLMNLGCGDQRSSGVQPNVDSSTLPEMPKPMPGQATLAGMVADPDGVPIAGATVKVAETDGKATSDDTGAYQIMVPSDSTVTLRTSAAGFASTFSESVVLADQATVGGFNVLLLTAEALSQMSTMGGDAPAAATVGVMALRLHSVGAACDLAGAHVSVWPPKAATVVYSQPSTTGGLDMPDPTMNAVQPGAQVGAWLVAALPPGNMLQITVEQSGCQQLVQSPSMGGLMYPGLRRVEAQALTAADIFLQ